MIKVIVSTRDAGENWYSWCNSQVNLLVYNVDSSSSAPRVEISKRNYFLAFIIKPEKFNHDGNGSSNFVFNQFCDFVVFLTQDIFLSNNNSIKNIVGYFEGIWIGAVCGRQLPSDGANPISSHARFYNYPILVELWNWLIFLTIG